MAAWQVGPGIAMSWVAELAMSFGESGIHVDAGAIPGWGGFSPPLQPGPAPVAINPQSIHATWRSKVFMSWFSML
jgi:hypothetical protein